MTRPGWPPRVLVAGVGNVLRRDDGFGPAVVKALAADPLPPGVRVVELGIAGVGLVQELMDGYDALVIVDAVEGGAAPGSVFVLDPEVPELAELSKSDHRALAADMHTAVPERALLMARAAGVLPRFVRLVGCQPDDTDAVEMALSPPVAEALPRAVATIRALLAELGDRTREECTGGEGPAHPGGSGADDRAAVDGGADSGGQGRGAAHDPAAALERRDEVLQVMFWLQGEGFGQDVDTGDLLRFVQERAAVEEALTHLIDAGYVECRSDDGLARYRLTSLGEREGRRRFLEEFEPYLARRAHGECGVADCGCHDGQECRA